MMVSTLFFENQILLLPFGRASRIIIEASVNEEEDHVQAFFQLLSTL